MISVQNLSARVGSFLMRDVSFTVPTGCYGVVIGPAGSGKTTLLEAIGGVVPITSGVVRLNGRDVTQLPPEDRGVGLVYQHGYLFPHLTVGANVAYGVVDASAARAMMERFEITELQNRVVRSLSGGEQQIVALVRALARSPAVLLLDEPFSALDPRRRARVRREVRALHRERECTVLQVTHDFTEAGLLGDIAVLLDAGRVLQAGAPDEVFRHPASPAIAEFLGAENVFAGTVVEIDDPSLRSEESLGASNGRARYQPFEFCVAGTSLRFMAVGEAQPGPSHAVLRAEEVVISRDLSVSSARNAFPAVVRELAMLGALTRVTVEVSGLSIVAALTTRAARELELAPGVPVHVSFKAMAVHLC
jgi:molybdopterin-binding protein